MDKIKVTVIGAGIVGLAIAKELSSVDGSIFVIERNEAFGMETSSRNSEVIHAGIYYPTGTLRHRLCIEGNRLLYDLCREQGIQSGETGKLIVAVKDEEVGELHELYENGIKNEVPGLKMISSAEALVMEPSIACKEAIFSPTTGIVDSHEVMKHCLSAAEENGATTVFNTQVSAIEKKSGGGYIITVVENDGSNFVFESEIVINSAGLESDTIAALAGIDIKKEGYLLNYCKGSYFRVQDCSKFGIKHLVYPVVKKDSVSLGIHVALDLNGAVRLGPDAEYLDKREQDYSVPDDKRKAFYDSVSEFIPAIKMEQLYPDTSGIRPKLQGKDEGFRDFIIKEESEHGLKDFINLVGIDSPGLTASLAIAGMVKRMLYS